MLPIVMARAEGGKAWFSTTNYLGPVDRDVGLVGVIDLMGFAASTTPSRTMGFFFLAFFSLLWFSKLSF